MEPLNESYFPYLCNLWILWGALIVNSAESFALWTQRNRWRQCNYFAVSIDVYQIQNSVYRTLNSFCLLSVGAPRGKRLLSVVTQNLFAKRLRRGYQQLQHMHCNNLDIMALKDVIPKLRVKVVMCKNRTKNYKGQFVGFKYILNEIGWYQDKQTWLLLDSNGSKSNTRWASKMAKPVPASRNSQWTTLVAVHHCPRNTQKQFHCQALLKLQSRCWWSLVLQYEAKI